MRARAAGGAPARRFRLEWLLLGLALGGLVLAFGALLAGERARIERQEHARLLAAARIVGDNLAYRLRRADQTLNLLVNDLDAWRGHEGTPAGLRDLQKLRDVTGLRFLWLLDASGRVVSASHASLLGRDFSARDYFTRPRQQAPRPDPAMLYVSPPFISLSGLVTVTVSRALVDAAGRFAGVAVASFDPDYSSELLESLLYAPDMRIWLMHGEGRLFQTMPARPDLVGKRVDAPGSLLSLHRAGGQPVSMLTGNSLTTGERRMVALRTIVAAGPVRVDQPLVVSAGREVAAVFADWNRQVATECVVFLLFALAAVCGLATKQCRQRRFDTLAALHAASEREAAARFKLASQAVGFGVWELDLASNRLSLDDGIRALYGWERAAPVDLDVWRGAVLPEDLPAAEVALQASIAEGAQIDKTFRIRRADGAVRLIRAVAHASCGGAGRLEKIVGINQDITDEWQSEARMHARKLEAVGTLAAGIAHEFNSILGSIVGFAEMTADDLPPGSPGAQNMEQIICAGFRARDLIARILDFARESPARPLALLDVASQVREALAMLRALLPPSLELSFQDRIGPAGAGVLADSTQLQQIVMNLCINAADAMDGHGVVAIGLEPAGQAGDAPPDQRDGVCLSVADRGGGIAPALVARVFDPFFTTKAPGKGTGLGLSVVYGIVTELGGVIKVRSQAGGADSGTLFRVFLPLQKTPAAAPDGR